MPSFKYTAQILEFKEIHEMPDAWMPKDFMGLLNHIEYDDTASIAPEELKDMACLALSDFEVEAAAVKVLEFRLGETLNKGQRQNLAEELKEDRLWEEHSDIKLHEELFNVGCMLYWTFPNQFSTPDIVKLKIKITALNKESTSNLVKPTTSFLSRMLNDGMEENNIMGRLFGANIKSNNFSESAEHIIWKFEESGFVADDNSNTFSMYTSFNWVAKLKGVHHFESTAFSDGQL
tara:strand:- start:419 stop:1120 length:702 start_codon:yes stop_codon:yes gene_type:complete